LKFAYSSDFNILFSLLNGTKLAAYVVIMFYYIATDALKYLQEDSSVLPRIAVITVAGLGGIVAGYKGLFHCLLCSRSEKCVKNIQRPMF
jgi:hypothetical protein